jgi:ABC-type antimicrobial peptide transport system permease subunit
MFFTYLRRELRRRSRQAVVIALGFAVGIGLVITVTAASAGVKNAQGKVLHALYGVGTDVTVTTSPTAGSGGPFGFRVGNRSGQASRPKAGTTFTRDTLLAVGQGTLKTSSVTAIAQLDDVSTAAGGLTLTDTRISGKIPSSSSSSGGNGFGGAPGGGGGGGGGFSSFKISSFSVDGVDLATGKVGVLSSGKIVSGRTFRSSDADSDVALVSSGYANQHSLKTGSKITVAGTTFKVIGVANVPASTGANVYIPLERAQALSGMKGKVTTVYVAANSAANISAVSKEISGLLPKATVTTSSSLASQVTGSLSSASSLANKLGRWLAVAVLIAAFLLGGLLTMSAVSRRVREFGTLKALGWRTRRVVGQVMGEALATGLIGGIAGVALGFGGARLVSALSGPLSATTSLNNNTPGGAGSFGPPGGGGGFPGGGGRRPGGFGRLAAAAGSHTVKVPLDTTVTLGVVLLAVLLAVAGGLIAGSFGGWRAARLRPAAALAQVA